MSLQIKIHTYDKYLLLLMYLQLVILAFFGLDGLIYKIVLALIILRFCFTGIKIGVRKILIAFLGFMVLFMMSALSSGSFSFSILLQNGIRLICPMVYAFYVIYLCYYEPNIIDSLMKRGFWIFNITMIVNIIVMIVQIIYPYSINAVCTGAVNDFYTDLISGLFAYSSTHTVTLFSTFIVLYNLSCYKQIKTIMGKSLMIFYFAFLFISLSFISLFNDNKGFFLVLPIMLLVYIILTDLQNKVIKRVLFVICCVGVIVLLYYIIPPIKMFVDSNILNLIDRIQDSYLLGNQLRGSYERTAIIKYAFHQPSVWFFGDGIASVFMYQSGYRGFLHFGQANFGCLLLLGGIWLTIAIFSYYFIGFSKIIEISDGKKRGIIKICAIWGFLVMLTIYQQCFTNVDEMISLLLIILAIRYKRKNSLNFK